MEKTHIVWITICGVLLALLVHVTKATLERQSPEPKSVGKAQESQAARLLPHGEIKDGLAAFLLSNCNRFKLGEPVPLTYGIVCVGSGLEQERTRQEELADVKLEIRVWWLREGPELSHNYSWLEVTDPDGQNVPYRGSTGELQNLSVAPVEEIVRRLSVLLYHRQFVGMIFPDLRENFELTKPGVYRVRWGYSAPWTSSPWTGELMSNEVKFEIVK